MWLIAGTVNIIRLYDDVVIVYSIFEWFLFFTVWLIAGTVNIIRLYDDIVGEDISNALSGIRSQTDSVLDTVLEPTDITFNQQIQVKIFFTNLKKFQLPALYSIFLHSLKVFRSGLLLFHTLQFYFFCLFIYYKLSTL